MVPGKVWNIPIIAVERGWLTESLVAVVPQKGVNNQMEANDRQQQSGGDGKNTTKVQKLIIIRSQRLFTEGGFIF